MRRAGQTGPIIIRADAGFENHKLLNALQKPGIEFSIAVKQGNSIKALIEQIPESDWVTIELAIRDLKEQALAHFRSGRMHANSAWTVIAALAHNLGRWTTQIGQPNRTV